MTDKHTPGPWTVEMHLPVFHGDKATYSVVDADGTTVAIFGTDRTNARFIAAAPELLEVLEAANGMIESLMIDYECPNDHEDCITFKDAVHIQTQARAAIKAAKGE